MSTDPAPSDPALSDPYGLAELAGAAIRDRFGVANLDSAFVLGSGWSAAAEDLGELIGSCELAELPGFTKPTVLGHGGALRVVTHRRRPDRRDLHRPDPLLRGTRRTPGRARRPGGRGGGRQDHRADQRLRRAQPGLAAGHHGADLRPHQPDRRHPAGRRDLHRHDGGVLPPAARSGPDRRPGPARGRVRPVPRAAVRDAGRGADGRGAGRGPGRHVHRPGDDRRPASAGWRCSASRWSPTWPPASPPNT